MGAITGLARSLELLFERVFYLMTALFETNIVVLCGGKGTRLGPLTKEKPKPLLTLGQFPFLFHLLRRFQQEGFKRFILAVHYLADQFYEFTCHYQKEFSNIQMVVEKEPLGTGGALKNAAQNVHGECFVALNGDVFIPQSLAPIVKHHLDKKNIFTMVAVKAENVDGVVHNKGGLVLGTQDEILSFGGHQCLDEKWVNAGLYVVNKEKILTWPEGHYDLEQKLASLLKPDIANAFRSSARLLDIGTPECFELAKRSYETYSLPSC